MITKDLNPRLEGPVLPSPVDPEDYMVMLVYKNGSLAREGSVFNWNLYYCAHSWFHFTVTIIFHFNICLNHQTYATDLLMNVGSLLMNISNKHHLWMVRIIFWNVMPIVTWTLFSHNYVDRWKVRFLLQGSWNPPTSPR